MIIYTRYFFLLTVFLQISCTKKYTRQNLDQYPEIVRFDPAINSPVFPDFYLLDESNLFDMDTEIGSLGDFQERKLRYTSVKFDLEIKKSEKCKKAKFSQFSDLCKYYVGHWGESLVAVEVGNMERKIAEMQFLKDLTVINQPYARNYAAKISAKGSDFKCLENLVEIQEIPTGILFRAEVEFQEAIAFFSKRNIVKYVDARDKILEKHRYKDKRLKYLPCGRQITEKTYKTDIGLLKNVPTLKAEYVILTDEYLNESLLFE